MLINATPEQVEANKRLGEQAKAAVGAVAPETIEKMTSLDKKMKACRKAGGSESSCGMQIMMAMQSDPALIPQNGETSFDMQGTGEASKFQPWFNEGCAGHMTVNDSRKLDDPTIAGEEPTIHTSGTVKIDTRDTLVTVETDLIKGSTRYMIVAPQASGFQQEAYYGEVPKTVAASAMPKSVLIVGPFAGPIQSGTYSYKISGGEVLINWTFRRL